MSGYPPGPFDIQWALVEELAKSPRPGYPERQGIGTDEVEDWIEEIRGMGIRSIICFSLGRSTALLLWTAVRINPILPRCRIRCRTHSRS